MMATAQLEQELTDHTAIELLAPDWIKHWSAPFLHTAIVPVHPTMSYFAEATYSFERSFSRQQPTAVLRLTYCSAADRLAGLVEWSLLHPLHTPISIGERSIRPAADQLSPTVLISHLFDWLKVTYDELAAMTGVSRSALFYWRKTGVTPRLGNVRQVMRLYSLASLLVRRFGKEGARQWLQGEGKDAWDSLRTGDIERAEDSVRSRLFGQRLHHTTDGYKALSEGADFSGGVGVGRPVKRAARRPKSGRPGSL